MVKPLVGLLCVGVLAFGVKWYGASGELAEAQARITRLEEQLEAAQRRKVASTTLQLSRSAEPRFTSQANAVRVEELPEEQQAALMLAALANANRGGEQLAEARHEAEMLRRRLDRAESAKGRAEKARRESSDKREEMLRERQALLDENAQLREALTRLTAAIAEATSEQPREPFLRR